MTIIYLLDILGTFVFAVSGASKAVKYKLDYFGILTLAIATGIGGGIIRDLALGKSPPVAFSNEIYLLACFLGAVVVILGSRGVIKHRNIVLQADAIGLGVFCAGGAAKAASYGLGPIGIIMIATVTACGGGMIRDILVREIPMILERDFYASAVILGSLSLVFLRTFGADESIQLYIATALTTLIRLLAIKYKFRLPKVV